MSDWEHDANAALRALGEAWQQGGLSRETYRARRRRLIATLRERRDETQRHPLPPARVPAAARSEYDAAAVIGLGRGTRVAWRWLALALAVAVAAATWWMWIGERGNV